MHWAFLYSGKESNVSVAVAAIGIKDQQIGLDDLFKMAQTLPVDRLGRQLRESLADQCS